MLKKLRMLKNSKSRRWLIHCSTLNSDTFRVFAKPKSGRIAVGDEVMKVFRV